MELNVKLSARNTLSGKIVELRMGQTTSHVKIDIGGDHIITASITNEAVDELNLKVGDQAWAVIKASDVMVAKGT
jgi:molybdopterin-binding protein